MALEEALKHLNLSNQCVSTNNLHEAQQHLYQALRINPHYPEAYNNLGRLLYKQKRFSEAIPLFEKALRLNPDYFEAHYNLANTFSQLNQFTRAQYYYQTAVSLHPEHADAHHNLGLIYFQAENYLQAKIHLEKACRLDPNHLSIRLFLGQTYLALGNTEKAKTLYQEILVKDELISEAHHNLAILYLSEKDNSNALEHFKRALHYEPSNETAAHMVRALSGVTPSTETSQNYVRALFDQYADYYNAHMKEKLQYQAPYLLRDRLGSYLGGHLKPGRILDLGCGTGLCGIYFRDLARTLIGVDISPNMLEKAKQLKDAYDELILQEITEYLNTFVEATSVEQTSVEPTSVESTSQDKLFDLVIASDVLVYFGDLQTIFNGVARCLLPQAHFIFTIEVLNDAIQTNYKLQPTGRFAHSLPYIQMLGARCGFNIQLSEPIRLRHQADTDVLGQLFIMCKCPL